VTRFLSTAILLKTGDLTEEQVDVIVNAANSGLMGGGGVDGAIHRAGGPSILAECEEIRARLGRCPTGQAVITGAGALAARHVVHAVGPRWQGGLKAEPRLLRDAWLNSLARAAEVSARTVAFPSLSTGAYGFPILQAAPIALTACRDFVLGGWRELVAQPPILEEIRIVLFTLKDLKIYQEALDRIAAES
jgi:O-acetyl-ADP-ribose deacetylase